MQCNLIYGLERWVSTYIEYEIFSTLLHLKIIWRNSEGSAIYKLVACSYLFIDLITYFDSSLISHLKDNKSEKRKIRGKDVV